MQLTVKWWSVLRDQNEQTGYTILYEKDVKQ